MIITNFKLFEEEELAPDCEIGEYVLCNEHPNNKYIKGSISNTELDNYFLTHIGQITGVFLNEYDVEFYDENFPESWAKHWFRKTGDNLYSRRFKKAKIIAHAKRENDIKSIIIGRRFDL